ncbi:hypothetical protein B0H16DRAFT_1729647 [Mycena metata]|uniref:Secreted protein n=1 Tax=Mycena metata TaxID=1033252 RepID=A0AAD7IAU5_9AGAR|nr:hypothetical protein B0H16DRAFT_1729647 [Mycena metata]
MAVFVSLAIASLIENSTLVPAIAGGGVNLGSLTLNGDHVAWFSGHPKATTLSSDRVTDCNSTPSTPLQAQNQLQHQANIKRINAVAAARRITRQKLTPDSDQLGITRAFSFRLILHAVVVRAGKEDDSTARGRRGGGIRCAHSFSLRPFRCHTRELEKKRIFRASDRPPSHQLTVMQLMPLLFLNLPTVIRLSSPSANNANFKGHRPRQIQKKVPVENG